jgi:hypothetical protein
MLAPLQPRTKNSAAYQRKNKVTRHPQQAMKSGKRNFDVMLQFAELSITRDNTTHQPMVAYIVALILGPHFT